MPAPKADPPQCDVDGCGALADMMTDGTEKDTHVRLAGADDKGFAYEPLNRKAVPFLNVCGHHHNWPFSEDAKSFTAHKDTGLKYAARAAAAQSSAPKGK